MTDAASKTRAELLAMIGGFETPDPKLFFTAPHPDSLPAEQTTDVLFAMLLFGEARGESRQAVRAVAQVAVNRARFPHRVFGSRAGATFDANLRAVILQPRQFSCMHSGDVNYQKVRLPLRHEDPWVWRMCLDTAREAMAQHRRIDRLTANSDHYFDESLLQPPTWADPAKQTVEIGRLRFYRLYLPSPRADAGTPARAEAPSSRPVDAEEAAAALPSPLASSPPRARRRAASALLRVREGVSRRHCPAGAGSGSHVSAPAPHHPSQRTPRLGLKRWSLRSRGLSSLSEGQQTGLAARGSGLGKYPVRLGVLVATASGFWAVGSSVRENPTARKSLTVATTPKREIRAASVKSVHPICRSTTDGLDCAQTLGGRSLTVAARIALVTCVAADPFAERPSGAQRRGWTQSPSGEWRVPNRVFLEP
jgi:hypothetical protein